MRAAYGPSPRSHSQTQEARRLPTGLRICPRACYESAASPSARPSRSQSRSSTHTFTTRHLTPAKGERGGYSAGADFYRPQLLGPVGVQGREPCWPADWPAPITRVIAFQLRFLSPAFRMSSTSPDPNWTLPRNPRSALCTRDLGRRYLLFCIRLFIPNKIPWRVRLILCTSSHSTQYQARRCRPGM